MATAHVRKGVAVARSGRNEGCKGHSWWWEEQQKREDDEDIQSRDGER